MVLIKDRSKNCVLGMKKKKAFKDMLKKAKLFLDQIGDDQISDLDGMQTTMNQFLESQGLPPVGLPGLGNINSVPVESRTFEEIENDLFDMGINS